MYIFNVLCVTLIVFGRCHYRCGCFLALAAQMHLLVNTGKLPVAFRVWSAVSCATTAFTQVLCSKEDFSQKTINYQF